MGDGGGRPSAAARSEALRLDLAGLSPPSEHDAESPRRAGSRPVDWATAAAGSLGIVDGPRLTDDGDLDLPRVGQLLLHLPRHVLRQPERLLVRDLVAVHDD